MGWGLYRLLYLYRVTETRLVILGTYYASMDGISSTFANLYSDLLATYQCALGCYLIDNLDILHSL